MPDSCRGVGFAGVVCVLVDGVVLVPVVFEPLLELGAAAAPAMPATAPALASAPAITVAPSIFENLTASNLLSVG